MKDAKRLPHDTTAEDFISMSAAPSHVGKAQRTIYKWVQDGRVRWVKPRREVWLYLPDLLDCEGNLRRGRPRSEDAS